MQKKFSQDKRKMIETKTTRINYTKIAKKISAAVDASTDIKCSACGISKKLSSRMRHFLSEMIEYATFRALLNSHKP